MLMSWAVPGFRSASALQLQPAPLGPGVSRALARERAARVSGVSYALNLELRPHADLMRGQEILRFSLSAAGTDSDLPLDYREGALTSARLNGSPLAPKLNEGHLLLPAALLHAGQNTVEIAFASRVAAAGAAITRYEDKSDGSEYLYSLFVPMDASMAFPCFDQPDLKARFTLALTAPEKWTVISNTAPQRGTPPAALPTADTAGLATTRFPPTQPISTYLFAFAAGPWARLAGQPGQSDVYVRQSQLQRARPEIPQLQVLTARGMAWLTRYFHQPFPFPKYDMVLIPGFPFGGMEHAGATFLNEDGVLFRTAPTAADRFHRSITTLHELTHQWFGDLVTMRWFDDLWLKEGFAQYMAYRCLASLEPDSLEPDSLVPEAQVWKHFYEDIKPNAYAIDETPGTTPIFQDIPNLKDAKSAYGAIVYMKAPALLKQLEFRLGPVAFRRGLRLYLEQHAYGNAQWSDLVAAFHTASGQDVRTWADAWVLRRGMPEVDVAWSCGADGKLNSLRLSQHDVLPDGYLWPISQEVVLAPAMRRVRADWSQAETAVPAAVGQPCPSFVFANAGDQAYGRFLLDPRSEAAVRQSLLSTVSSPLRPLAQSPPMVPGRAAPVSTYPSPDPLLRSMLWGALWENVRQVHSPPLRYVELVLTSLPAETDETLARIQGSNAVTALHFYVSAHSRASLAPQLEAIATQRMLTAPSKDLRIVSFRTLTAVAETPPARQTLKQLLSGNLSPPGVELRQLDRWRLVGQLLSLNDPDASSLVAQELKQDHSGDAQKSAWAVQAGSADPAVKQFYFEQYQIPPSAAQARPEDWLTRSLGPFNAWNQSTLTEPYLRSALAQLPEIKRDRKIFFLGVWLNEFLGGQSSASAEATVQDWLAQPGIDPDLRLKVLENNDELQRTVRIRQKFPD